jgi:hypothetical protein
MFTVLAGLILLAVAIPVRIVQIAVGNRAIPLPQRNLTRATVAAFALIFLVTSLNTLSSFIPPAALLGVAGVAVFFLVVGVSGSRGLQFDPAEFSVWVVGALVCAVLHFGEILPAAPMLSEFLPFGWPRLIRALLDHAFLAGMVACATHFLLMLRPAPSASLPDPATVPGMPMAGPASLGAASAAMSRRGAARPKFRT